jgi:hypothetical protein
MAWTIPTPRELLRSGRAAAGWTIGTAAFIIVLPARLAVLLTAVERLLTQVSTVVDNASVTVARADAVAARAGGVVASAGDSSTQAQQLLELYRPLAQRLAPMAQQLADSISAEEVQATIKLINILPEFVEAMQSDIMPVLATLDGVAPDLAKLLNVARDVREAIVGIPGFKFFRKRGEHMIEPEHQPNDPAG